MIHPKEDLFFHLCLAVSTLLFVAIPLAIFPFVKIQVDFSSFLLPLLVLSFFAFGAWFYLVCRPKTKLAHLFLSAFWGGALSQAYFFPMYLLYRLPTPFRDREFASIDGYLGWESPKIFIFLQHHPLVESFFNGIYLSLFPLLLLAMIVPPLRSQWRKTKTLHLTLLISSLLSFPLIALLPALSSWAYYGYSPSPLFVEPIRVAQALKSGTPLIFSLEKLLGLVELPSFHTILALLSYQALSETPYLRRIALILAILTPLSALTSGGHYSIDIVGGVVVAFVSHKFACGLLRYFSFLSLSDGEG